MGRALLLLAALAALCAGVAALPDLAQAAAADPGIDFYADVAEREWRAWEADGALPENATIGELFGSVRSLWPVRVSVRLVGWSPLLVTQLRSARLPHVRPQGRGLGEAAARAWPDMPVRVQFAPAAASTQRAVEAARDAELARSGVRAAEISAEDVEAALEADYAALPAVERVPWTLYVLNLSRPAHGNTYAYAAGAGACATPLMVSAARRFGWVDQAAGPCEWGPVVAGHGFVDGRHAPLTPDPPLADVLAFVQRSVALLLAPSAVPLPPYLLHAQPLLVRLLLLRTAAVPAAEPLPWSHNALAAALAAAAPSDVRVRVESRTVALSDWPAAAAALASAVRTRTSAYHADEQLKVLVHPYLDATLLAAALAPALPALDAAPAGGAERVVRAVVLDLGGAEALLLDRLHQALPVSPALVLAVQTNVSRLSLDFRCGRRPLALDARNATRALLAALLSAAFGAAPAHRLVRAEGGDEEALEWAAGRALGGPFSAYADVSATHADAVRRAFVVQVANASATRLAHLAEQPDLDARPGDVLAPAAALALRRRLLLLRFLWLSAAQALADAEHGAALALARAADREVDRLERVAMGAAAARRAELQCPAPRVLALDRALLALSALLLAVASAAFYAVNHRKH